MTYINLYSSFWNYINNTEECSKIVLFSSIFHYFVKQESQEIVIKIHLF